MTRRADVRVLRNDATGVTWTVTPVGGTLHVEMVFDDEPDEVVKRTLDFPVTERAGALDRVIAKQVSEGFVLQPPWRPSAEWIRDAEDQQLALEVGDPWLLAFYADTSLFERMPGSVRSYLALDTFCVQAMRNGFSSFLTEDDPQLIHHLPHAARELGLGELAALWEQATAGMDLRALERIGATRVKLGSAAAAKKLEALALEVVTGPLPRWIRAHAQDFASLAALRLG